MTQIIEVLAQNQPGVLLRVAGIITAKGFNIEALYVQSHPDRPGLSTIRLIAENEPRLRKRVIQEIDRLIQVIEVADVTPACYGSEKP